MYPTPDNQGSHPRHRPEGMGHPTPEYRTLRLLFGSLRPWLILGLVCAVFSLHPDFRSRFWTRDHLPDVLQQSARNIVLAVGMSFVILTGGIDLSVGSVLALSGVGMAMALSGQPPLPLWLAFVIALPVAAFAASLFVGRARQSDPRVRWLLGGLLFLLVEAGAGFGIAHGVAGGVKVEGALLIGLLIGTACGLINGWGVSLGRVPPFVMTLGMMSAARGLTLYATNSRSVSVAFPRFRALGEGMPLILITLAVVALGTVLLTRMRAGRYFLSIGGNELASRLSGVSVARHKTLAYILSGAGAAIGAILVTAKFGTANTGAATGAELDAIAAVVIGGTSLSGGQGSIVGALVGALTITVITSGLVLVNIEVTLQQVILGGIIVLAVFVDQIRKKRY
jgi:ribose/xylose/arabinose/galactoside ABC-type transport system permease subunit